MNSSEAKASGFLTTTSFWKRVHRTLPAQWQSSWSLLMIGSHRDRSLVKWSDNSFHPGNKDAVKKKGLKRSMDYRPWRACVSCLRNMFEMKYNYIYYKVKLGDNCMLRPSSVRQRLPPLSVVFIFQARLQLFNILFVVLDESWMRAPCDSLSDGSKPWWLFALQHH